MASNTHTKPSPHRPDGSPSAGCLGMEFGLSVGCELDFSHEQESFVDEHFCLLIPNV